MKFFGLAAVALIALPVLPTAIGADEIKVTGVHNCCGACCKAIQEALGKVEGITEVTAKPKEADFTFQAADAKTARKGLAALARAGFHGKTGKKKLKFPANSGVEPGKATRLALVGIHNCCPGCSQAAKDAVAKVEGVEASVSKKRTFVVEGDFDAAAVVKALNDVGFHVRKQGAGRKKKDSK